MARRVPRAALALVAAATAVATVAAPAVLAQPPAAGRTEVEEPVFSTLASYRFDGGESADNDGSPDGGLPDSGPDTFTVYEKARGHVDASETFRWSGTRSVEIRDVAGDGDFPGLQGYFPLQESGVLWAHFALLFTDPEETFNVALAGPAGFGLSDGGIAFWLTVRDGRLTHVSDGIPRKLFPIVPFTWYLVDVWYDVAAGRYDLAVRVEGEADPVVALVAQPNVASRPGSAVDKFSFIGDTGDDLSAVVYYVDDVVLGRDGPVDLTPFLAPGRRELFLDTLAVERPETRFDENGEPTAAWLEWDGDRAAAEGALAAAEDAYRRALDRGGEEVRLLLKLADVRFLAGDQEGERELRERVYGRL